MVLNSTPKKVRPTMSISLAEDIRSVTDLKRHTREILDHVHQSGRPVVLTVNGRADSVIIDAKVYEKQVKAMNLARLLSEAEAQVAAGQTRPARVFLDEFKNARGL
jgi:prevent-host-death family protein